MIERCLPCWLISCVLWSRALLPAYLQPGSMFYTITDKPEPIFLATMVLSPITPRRHSSAYRYWTTSHFIRCFIRKARKKWGSWKWLPSFADFFVLCRKAFLHLRWCVQAVKRNPSCQFRFHSIYQHTQLNELFKWGCYEMKWIWICITDSFNYLWVGVTHMSDFSPLSSWIIERKQKEK